MFSVSVKEWPPLNVGGLVWRSAPSGREGSGSERQFLCSHLEIVLPSAVALCNTDHTCFRALTPTAEHSTQHFKHAVKRVFVRVR